MPAGIFRALIQEFFGVLDLPVVESSQSRLARSIGFLGVGPGCAENGFRLGIVLEPGQPFQSGHADPRDGIVGGLDQGRPEGFVVPGRTMIGS